MNASLPIGKPSPITANKPAALPGGVISAVHPGGIAEECGIVPGDRLLEINGHPLRDIIDYQFHVTSEDVNLLYSHGSEEGEVSVEKDWDDDLGVDFAEPLFDGVRSCRNNCVFCFVRNLPPRMRRTLYVKDDDYRLSFLFGNFITMSNLSEADLDRIEEQRLSPLFVSVHATDRELRNRLLGFQAPDPLEQMDELGRRGIELHAQIVLCPGLNDGEALDKTIADLGERSSFILSAAAVPVGITRFCRNADLRPYTAEEAGQVVRQVSKHQARLRAELGRGFVHLSDEFYVTSGLPFPPARWYDGYPQIENGIGLVRRLLQSWGYYKRRLPARLQRPRRIGLVCGTSASGTLRRIAEDMNRVDGLSVTVYPVPNHFFGTSVTVSGLLTGADVVSSLKDRGEDAWILPRAMFDSDGVVTLDDMTLEQIREQLGAPVNVAGDCRTLLRFSLLESELCAEL